MPLEERVFMTFKEAAETYMRIGFEWTPSKELVCNTLRVMLTQQGNMWKSCVEVLDANKYQANP